MAMNFFTNGYSQLKTEKLEINYLEKFSNF